MKTVPGFLVEVEFLEGSRQVELTVEVVADDAETAVRLAKRKLGKRDGCVVSVEPTQVPEWMAY